VFKPFIIHKLVEKGIAETVKRAKKIVEKESPEVYEILEEIIQDHPVLLNARPRCTAWASGVRAGAREGKAIRIHPLVCAAFNADFDGDQMAVHVPLSSKANRGAGAHDLVQQRAQALGRPARGRAVADMVLGCYFLTKEPADFEQAEVKAKAAHVAHPPSSTWGSRPSAWRTIRRCTSGTKRAGCTRPRVG